jgi:hypothetical protein
MGCEDIYMPGRAEDRVANALVKDAVLELVRAWVLLLIYALSATTIHLRLLASRSNGIQLCLLLRPESLSPLSV